MLNNYKVTQNKCQNKTTQNNKKHMQNITNKMTKRKKWGSSPKLRENINATFPEVQEKFKWFKL